MSLPSAWIDRIFTRLSTIYGHHFIGRWSGLDIAEVKAEWGEELAFYGAEERAGAIRYALEHLPPDNPPNVLQFRALCRQAPELKPLALPAPSAEGLKRMANVMSGAPRMGGVTFADMLARHRRIRDEGRQSPAQREWLQRVESAGDYAATEAADFQPIPANLLPPEMRQSQ